MALHLENPEIIVNLSIYKKVPFDQYPWYFNVQLVNILVPIVSYPYLLRIIGPDKYGLIAIASSVSAIVATITEYGVSFTGVRDIARISDDIVQIAKYYFTSIILRLFVFLMCSVILIPIYYFIPLVQNEFTLFTLTFAGIIPALIFPPWLFMGMQKIRQYNAILIVNKLISISLVFLLIRERENYKIYPLVQLIPAIISSIICLSYLNKLGIRFRLPMIGNIQHHLRDGFFPFISQGLISLYVQLNPLLLMLLIQNVTMVGYYAVAEKIVVMTKNLFSPLNQIYLPNISKQFIVSAENAIEEIKQYSKVVAFVNIIGMLLLIAFADQIVTLFAGEQYSSAVNIVRLLSPILLFVGLNNLAGIQTLLNLEMKKEFFIGILSGVMSNTLILILLVPYLSYISPAVSWTISEAVVLGIFVLYIGKRKKGWKQ